MKITSSQLRRIIREELEAKDDIIKENQESSKEEILKAIEDTLVRMKAPAPFRAATLDSLSKDTDVSTLRQILEVYQGALAKMTGLPV